MVISRGILSQKWFTHPWAQTDISAYLGFSRNMMRGEKKINGKTKGEGISLQIEPIQLDASPYSLSVGSIRSLETNGILLWLSKYPSERLRRVLKF
jgi:hypothetical protein